MRYTAILSTCLLATKLNASEPKEHPLLGSAFASCIDTGLSLKQARNADSLNDFRYAKAEKQIPPPISTFAIWTHLHELQLKIRYLHEAEALSESRVEQINEKIIEAWTTTRSALLGKNARFTDDGLKKLQDLSQVYLTEICPTIKPKYLP